MSDQTPMTVYHRHTCWCTTNQVGVFSRIFWICHEARSISVAMILLSHALSDSLPTEYRIDFGVLVSLIKSCQFKKLPIANYSSNCMWMYVVVHVAHIT